MLPCVAKNPNGVSSPSTWAHGPGDAASVTTDSGACSSPLSECRPLMDGLPTL